MHLETAVHSAAHINKEDAAHAAEAEIKESNYHSLAQRRANILSICIICFFSQFILLCLILREILSVDNIYQFIEYENSTTEMLARVICANMLHMSLVNEYVKGLNSMKYVLNHAYRFTHWQIAYLMAFF